MLATFLRAWQCVTSALAMTGNKTKDKSSESAMENLNDTTSPYLL